MEMQVNNPAIETFNIHDINVLLVFKEGSNNGTLS